MLSVCFQISDGSALHQAALYGRIDVVKLLLERGSDINAACCYCRLWCNQSAFLELL